MRTFYVYTVSTVPTHGCSVSYSNYIGRLKLKKKSGYIHFINLIFNYQKKKKKLFQSINFILSPSIRWQ